MSRADAGDDRAPGNRLHSRFEREAASPGLLLWRVTNRWQAVMRLALSAHALTHVQYVLLADLTWNDDDGGVTQAELSQRVRTDPMMVSQVVRALEKKGLVIRREDARDRRAVRVSATPQGAALARAATRDVEDADHAFFKAVTGKESSLLAHLAILETGAPVGSKHHLGAHPDPAGREAAERTDPGPRRAV